MSEDIKLKPCPFCGGKAELVADVFDQKRIWYVRCCGTGCAVFSETADRPTPQEAAKLWNRRAGERWPE